MKNYQVMLGTEVKKARKRKRYFKGNRLSNAKANRAFIGELQASQFKTPDPFPGAADL